MHKSIYPCDICRQETLKPFIVKLGLNRNWKKYSDEDQTSVTQCRPTTHTLIHRQKSTPIMSVFNASMANDNSCGAFLKKITDNVVNLFCSNKQPGSSEHTIHQPEDYRAVLASCHSVLRHINQREWQAHHITNPVMWVQISRDEWQFVAKRSRSDVNGFKKTPGYISSRSPWSKSELKTPINTGMDWLKRLLIRQTDNCTVCLNWLS